MMRFKTKKNQLKKKLTNSLMSIIKDLKRNMKIIGYLTEENDKLYDVNTMMKILGTSKSKIQREIKKIGISKHVMYKNQFLYTEKTLFKIIEKLIIEKLEKKI